MIFRNPKAGLIACVCLMGAMSVWAGEAATTQPAAQADKKPATTQPAPEAKPGEYQQVSFNELSGYKVKFKYTMGEMGEKMIAPGSLNPQIPANLKELAGKKVAIKGYLLVLEYDAGKSTRFILMKAVPDCLYCTSPPLMDWVDSSSKEPVAVPKSGQVPVEVRGTFEVGEKQEDGLITSVYQMKVDSVEVLPMEAIVAKPGGVAPGHGAGHMPK